MKLPLPQTVALIVARANTLTPTLVAHLEALGPPAIKLLIGIATGERRDLMSGKPWSQQLQALALIKALHPPEAIRPLFNLIVHRRRDEDRYCDEEIELDDKLMGTLDSYGAAALEPGLDAYAETKTADTRRTVCAVLSNLGVHDARVRAILLHHLEIEPEHAASWLEQYGDVTTLEHIIERFNRYEVPDHYTQDDIYVVEDCASAIVALGGKLTPEQSAKLFYG